MRAKAGRARIAPVPEQVRARVASDRSWTAVAKFRASIGFVRSSALSAVTSCHGAGEQAGGIARITRDFSERSIGMAAANALDVGRPPGIYEPRDPAQRVLYRIVRDRLEAQPRSD
jgi:hypothetical protein